MKLRDKLSKNDQSKLRPAAARASVAIMDGGAFSKSAVWVESVNNYGQALANIAPSIPPTFSKCDVWVEDDNFYAAGENKSAFLVIGFDTEFQGPSQAASRTVIKAGQAKNEVLSYQAHCKLYDPEQPDAAEWGGVCYPAEGKRLALAEFLIFAIGRGTLAGVTRKIPRDIYLVGHFTRADMRAFADFDQLTYVMSAVRNTFVSVDERIPVSIDCGEEPVQLNVHVRDTGLLAATGSKSLAAIGEVVGVNKVVLATTPAEETQIKSRMKDLLRTQPDLFEKYAYVDAVICVRYLDEILRLCEAVLGKPGRPPLTLSGIGERLLLKVWEELDQNREDILGFKMERVRRWDNRLGKNVYGLERIPHERFHWHEPLAVEAYHGGRGEQFWFGPGWVDDWVDYDLSSAYPTAMSLIRFPDWDRTYVTTDLDEFTYTAMGVAKVKFRFPESVRYPTMPIRTERGIIFPREGETSCAAPEIALAVAQGADVTIEHGVIVPPREDTFVFEPYVKRCIAKRNEYPKGSLRNLAWKELTNATYGKLAQGLRQKRVFDLKTRDTKPLPPSGVTNAFFAAFTTSFVRATLGEIMNRLPREAFVFSCTTDGFLSNASEAQMAEATAGPVCRLYSERRLVLSGKSDAVDVKHRVRQPLGWRTRGQATILPGEGDPGDESNIVLAKGGIWTPPNLEDLQARNDYIRGLFLQRDATSVVDMTLLTGVRDMVKHGADLVERELSRSLNMEFDWKRRPAEVGVEAQSGHVCFSTAPWSNVGEFTLIRDYWDSWSSRETEAARKLLEAGQEPVSDGCIKTVANYRAFAEYADAKSGLAKADRRYLSSKDPDLKRLRQCLAIAWITSNAGLVHRQGGLSATQFADLLTDVGVPCKRRDIENAAKKVKNELGRNPRLAVFRPGSCPNTPRVRAALVKLQKSLPSLDASVIVAPASAGLNLMSALDDLMQEAA